MFNAQDRLALLLGLSILFSSCGPPPLSSVPSAVQVEGRLYGDLRSGFSCTGSDGHAEIYAYKMAIFFKNSKACIVNTPCDDAIACQELKGSTEFAFSQDLGTLTYRGETYVIQKR